MSFFIWVWCEDFFWHHFEHVFLKAEFSSLCFWLRGSRARRITVTFIIETSDLQQSFHTRQNTHGSEVRDGSNLLSLACLSFTCTDVSACKATVIGLPIGWAPPAQWIRSIRLGVVCVSCSAPSQRQKFQVTALTLRASWLCECEASANDASPTGLAKDGLAKVSDHGIWHVSATNRASCLRASERKFDWDHVLLKLFAWKRDLYQCLRLKSEAQWGAKICADNLQSVHLKCVC